jgi:hypothetical protein
MLIAGIDRFAVAKPDGRLINLLIRARQFNVTLLDSDGVPRPQTKRPSGLKRRATTLRRIRISAPNSLPPTPSKVTAKAPPPNSPKPVG